MQDRLTIIVLAVLTITTIVIADRNEGYLVAKRIYDHNPKPGTGFNANQEIKVNEQFRNFIDQYDFDAAQGIIDFIQATGTKKFQPNATTLRRMQNELAQAKEQQEATQSATPTSSEKTAVVAVPSYLIADDMNILIGDAQSPLEVFAAEAAAQQAAKEEAARILPAVTP